MYVCLCNAFTDRDVDRAIDAGAHTVGQVYKRLDAVPQCGKCKDTIRTMLTRRHATQSPLEAASRSVCRPSRRSPSRRS
ncbi:MAG TPA: (2Fe-2S)-binding protein [Thalassobaculum sp.]